jgi:hypothetical protein
MLLSSGLTTLTERKAKILRLNFHFYGSGILFMPWRCLLFIAACKQIKECGLQRT